MSDDPRRMDGADLVGTVLAGRYEVTGVLGKGGMGVVVEARQIAVDRKVAVKLLHPAFAANRQAVARFIREMKVTSRLEHPATVRVYDFGEAQLADGVHLFLVMELVQGKTLGKALSEEGLSLTRVLAIAEQIARALEAAHGEGIVHRDLKPDNVMLADRYGQADVVKVLDFGIARFVEGGGEDGLSEQQRAAMRLTAEGAVVGTPTYMSPEQATGGAIGPRSDLYSFGVMLFELATGRVPFTAPTTVSLMVKHVQEPPPRPSEVAPVPPRLEALILACLEKEPARRPESARAVADALAAIAREAAADRAHEEARVVRAEGPRVVRAEGPRVVRAEGPRFEAKKHTALAAETARGVGGRADDGAWGASGASARSAASGSPSARGRAWLGVGLAAVLVAAGVVVVVTSGGDEAAAPTVAPAHELGDAGGEELIADGSAASAAELVQPGRAEAEAEVASGRKAQNRQDWQAARAAYRRAIAIDPAWGLPRLNLALVELSAGRPAEALAEIDRLLAAHPAWPDGRLVRAQIGLALKDYEGAKKDAEVATVATPERAEAWFLLAESQRAIDGGEVSEAARTAYCRAKGLGMQAAAARCEPVE